MSVVVIGAAHGGVDNVARGDPPVQPVTWMSMRAAPVPAHAHWCYIDIDKSNGSPLTHLTWQPD
jgi:hypothetical protein